MTISATYTVHCDAEIHEPGCPYWVANTTTRAAAWSLAKRQRWTRYKTGTGYAHYSPQCDPYPEKRTP